MKKKLILIFINILILIVILTTVESIIWYKNIEQIKHEDIKKEDIENLRFHSGIKEFDMKLEYFPNKDGSFGRLPEGTQYKENSIVLFGCSFTYGLSLKNEQTFSYKLSHLAKVPVYNQAMSGWGIQHMYYQANDEKLYTKFPEPKYVIYTYIYDHIRRLYVTTFTAWNTLNEDFYLRYKEQNGELVQIKNNIPIWRQLKRLYIVNELNNYYNLKRFYDRNSIFYEKDMKASKDFEIKLFTESKKRMQKHWKNTEYIVFFYDDNDNTYLQEKLKEAGFRIIKSSELTKEDLEKPKYKLPNNHPNEDAWNLLVPELIKRLDL